MVSNETMNFVLQVQANNLEYNTKLVLFCIIFVYLVFMLWWSNKIIPFKTKREELTNFPTYKQIAVRLMRVISFVFIPVYPLIVGVFMYVDYNIDNLLTLLTNVYVVGTIIGGIVFILFGMTWTIDLLESAGIPLRFGKKGRIIRRRNDD